MTRSRTRTRSLRGSARSVRTGTSPPTATAPFAWSRHHALWQGPHNPGTSAREPRTAAALNGCAMVATLSTNTTHQPVPSAVQRDRCSLKSLRHNIFFGTHFNLNLFHCNVVSSAATTAAPRITHTTVTMMRRSASVASVNSHEAARRYQSLGDGWRAPAQAPASASVTTTTNGVNGNTSVPVKLSRPYSSLIISCSTHTCSKPFRLGVAYC